MLGLDGNEHDPTSSAMQRAHVEESGKLPARPPLDPLAESEYLRFSLKELFIATTVAAALLALFRAFGIFGALAAFVAAVAFTTAIFPRATRGQEPRQRLMFDFVWGVVMPIVCLVFDPFLFKQNYSDPSLSPTFNMEEFRLHEHGYVAYALIGWQVCVLSLWLVLGKVARPAAAVISGMLAVGVLIALPVAMLLLFPAIGGLAFFGIGALGATPWLTAYAYYRRSQLAYRLATQQCSALAAGFAFAAGAILAICLPIAGGVAMFFSMR